MDFVINQNKKETKKFHLQKYPASQGSVGSVNPKSSQKNPDGIQ